MFSNYIKIALRTVRRKLVYSLINVVGLSAGLLCVVFIYNWVNDELSYDSHIPHADQVYRVVAEAGTGEDRWHQTVTSLPLGTTMKDMFPEVVEQVRLDKNDALVQQGDVGYVEDYIVLTDPSFFDVFGYHLLQGNEKTALSNPYQVVLTETMAKKYFGDENPMGQTLKIFQYDPDGNGMDYEVTGVIADPPKNSHFTFNMLASMSTIASIDANELDNWGNNSYHTYVKLKEGASVSALEAKLPDMVGKNMAEMIEEYDLFYRFYLQPVKSIHLHSNLQYEFMANGNIEYVWMFSAIGLFILALAGINYVNLSTSFSLDRAREVGVRKVLGAYKGQLIKQHLTETLVLVLIALLATGILAELFKPYFYELTGKTHIAFAPKSLLVQLVILCLPLALIAGYFPAKLLAGLNTIHSLKGKVSHGKTNGLRKFLVSLQFGVTLVILSGLVVVKEQLHYVQHKDLGYDQSNLLVLKVNGSNAIKAGYQTFKNDLTQSNEVQNVTRSGSMITGGLGNSNAHVIQNGQKQFEKVYRLPVGYDYLNTYGINLLAGRFFSPEIHSDSTQSFVINEAMAKVFGWTAEEAINKEMEFIGRNGRIIGVVNNFHYNSLHYGIEPVCLFLRDNFSTITIKGKDPEALLAQTEALWKQHFPKDLFDYTFQDEALFQTYENDQRFGSIFNTFTLLSLLIALLGLFGLLGYTVQKMTKEIGIRKVFGARPGQIITLIARQFLKLIIFSALLAIPIAWWMMRNWLKDFTYHIDLHIWYFAIAVLLTLCVAYLIIFIQAYRPCLQNPANTLKEE